MPGVDRAAEYRRPTRSSDETHVQNSHAHQELLVEHKRRFLQFGRRRTSRWESWKMVNVAFRSVEQIFLIYGKMIFFFLFFDCFDNIGKNYIG